MRINHFQRGHIYRVSYRGYKHDPDPLVLILWAGDGMVHAININYLHKDIRDDMVDVLATMAMGLVDWRDAYKFYHDYLKHRAPHIISLAYRTYKAELIKGAQYVSSGAKIKVISHHRVSNQMQKEIAIAEIKRELHNHTISSHQAEQSARSYMDAVNRIMKRKEDYRQYTSIKPHKHK